VFADPLIGLEPDITDQNDQIRQLIDRDLVSALALLCDRDFDGAAFQIKRFARVLRRLLDGDDADKP
jgi:hypothetical protein